MSCYAVVGMGSIAKRHLANLRYLHPDAKIYSVSASGRNTELSVHADAVISLDQLLEEKPAYAIIASPAPYHVTTAKVLLQNGIAVLIEKPLADTVESCEELISSIDDSQSCVVSVGYCLRFLPSAQVVKNYLSAGKLGAIYNVESNVGQFLPSWRTDKNYKDSVSARKELGGGALLELSHELDYLFWLFGDLELQHSWLRTTDELGLDVEDIADLVLTTTSGTYISVHLDFVQKSTQRNCEFIGEKGRLVWDLMMNTVTVYHATGSNMLYAEPQYNKNGMYIDMLQAFENIKMQGMSHLATIESSLKVIELIEYAKQSNKWRRIA
ncbi:Gfo/Idh/MocA family oxidoreductase [Shewanella sp. NKUCC01_JLK]|uniref:Gfo/Idh/MocA family protein n=1 Tax=Shewanella sp. NKUCC01_JLK TaxID=2842123 RepID=UPI001C5BC0B6|nr:Gfo/Idh/MocA family oxidoreductase [Shewanella sp. NKUCC01_JLK]MBW3514096.1 Gfo/Idh/MocA family oxidoreductase [Shewanella sp. NKUCC01_JLK]